MNFENLGNFDFVSYQHKKSKSTVNFFVSMPFSILLLRFCKHKWRWADAHAISLAHHHIAATPLVIFR